MIYALGASLGAWGPHWGSHDMLDSEDGPARGPIQSGFFGIYIIIYIYGSICSGSPGLSDHVWTHHAWAYIGTITADPSPLHDVFYWNKDTPAVMEPFPNSSAAQWTGPAASTNLQKPCIGPWPLSAEKWVAQETLHSFKIES